MCGRGLLINIVLGEGGVASTITVRPIYRFDGATLQIVFSTFAVAAAKEFEPKCCTIVS